MHSRSTKDLIEPARSMIEKMLIAIEDAGISYCVSCTWRSDEDQHMLFMQGREPLNVVNEVRRKNGYWLITATENRAVVTNIQNGGYHQRRRAIDIYPLNAGKIVTSKRDPVWRRIGEIAAKHGVEWGGKWKGKFQDYPHFQVKE